MSNDPKAPPLSLPLNRNRVEMLFELLSKAAAPGEKATLLGGMYDQVKEIRDYHWPPVKP